LAKTVSGTLFAFLAAALSRAEQNYATAAD